MVTGSRRRFDESKMRCKTGEDAGVTSALCDSRSLSAACTVGGGESDPGNVVGVEWCKTERNGEERTNKKGGDGTIGKRTIEKKEEENKRLRDQGQQPPLFGFLVKTQHALTGGGMREPGEGCIYWLWGEPSTATVWVEVYFCFPHACCRMGAQKRPLPRACPARIKNKQRVDRRRQSPSPLSTSLSLVLWRLAGSAGSLLAPCWLLAGSSLLPSAPLCRCTSFVQG